ncbi:hypothetical protein [Cognatiluteimonas telluris]|uniref:hypothetical protein n=1 Tax=Cognatiluteimonas telluris TaxID=1104775 RepID=UPI00140B9326|nr:hypothetical protein [Lysobacter telluris]
MDSLKYKISQLDEAPPPWRRVRGDELSVAARYPATDSVSEWGDEILALDQLLVEGFVQKPLQKVATDAGRIIDKLWQSLRLLRAFFEAQGSRLHNLRSVLKGHGPPSERAVASKQARTVHGTLRAHFTALAGEWDAAFVRILRALGMAIHPD